MKLNSLPVADASLDRLYLTLVDRMEIARPAGLRTSSKIDQPLLVGWLKPMILLPTSLLTGIHPEHIEAILAHELAHVRRHDYIVSLLQAVVETLFFYHPAVW